MAAEKGGQGPRRPHSLAPVEPAQLQTPSIFCLWLWPPAINRGSDSIFFKNKYQTLSPQAQKSTPWLGQPSPCPSHYVQPPISVHCAQGTEKKLEVETRLGRAGAPPASSQLKNVAAPLFLLGSSFCSSYLPLPSSQYPQDSGC